MKISIITATYNSGKNIKDCLQSVAEQTYQDIGILLSMVGQQTIR